MNAGLKQLEKLYADAGLGKIEWTQRNHNSWMTLKQRPNSGVVDKNIPGRDYSPDVEKAFEASVEKNKELLEKLNDEPTPSAE